MKITPPIYYLLRYQPVRRYREAVREGSGQEAADGLGLKRLAGSMKKLGLWPDCCLLATFKGGQNAGSGDTAYAMRGVKAEDTGSQLLANNSFEAGDPPDSWLTWAGAASRQSNGGGAGTDGSYCGRHVPDSGAQSGFYQTGKLAAHKWYHVRGLVRTSEAGGLAPKLRQGTDNTWWTGANTTTDWQEVDFVAIAADNSLSDRFYAITATNGDASKYLEWDWLTVHEVEGSVEDVPDRGHGELINSPSWVDDGIQCVSGDKSGIEFPIYKYEVLDSGHDDQLHLFCRMKLPASWEIGKGMAALQRAGQSDDSNADGIRITTSSEGSVEVLRGVGTNILNIVGDMSWSAGDWVTWCMSMDAGSVAFRDSAGTELTDTYDETSAMNPDRLILGYTRNPTAGNPSNHLYSSVVLIKGAMTTAEKDAVMDLLP